MFWFVILLLLLAVPAIRMFALLMIVVVVFAMMGSHSSDAGARVLTYQELKNYPKDCSKADDQLKELREIQKIKNFDPNPDNLSSDDYLYNSRLKATIWWYAYTCDKS
jgi:hypothetical protein